MSFNEFQLLTKSGCVESLILRNSPVLYSDQLKVPLENLLQLIPNASSIVYVKNNSFRNSYLPFSFFSFDCCQCHITPETMDKLNSFKWSKKFDYFILRGWDNPIDIEEFEKFILVYIFADLATSVSTYYFDSTKQAPPRETSF